MNQFILNGIILIVCIISIQHYMHGQDKKGIEVYAENPHYLQYNGEPLLLLGASDDDNQFQSPTLEKEIEWLTEAGGYYFRCTMSSRNSVDLKPYVENKKEKYDLESFNPAYWNRFERFLKLTAHNDIIVQVEIWATCDFYDNCWLDNPYNPAVNGNYGAEVPGLKAEHHYKGWVKINPFFKSLPALEDNRLLLNIQKEFVNKLLELSLEYNHVLYSMDNETNAHPEWGKYCQFYLHHGKNKCII